MNPIQKDKSAFGKSIEYTVITVIVILSFLKIFNYISTHETKEEKALQETSQTISQEIEKNKTETQSIKESEASLDFGPYMKALQKEIKSNWNPPKSEETKRIVVSFIVHSDGTLSDIKILDPGVSGPKAQAAALKAIESSKIAPLPKGAGETVDIEFTFDYNVIRKNK